MLATHSRAICVACIPSRRWDLRCRWRRDDSSRRLILSPTGRWYEGSESGRARDALPSCRRCALWGCYLDRVGNRVVDRFCCGMRGCGVGKALQGWKRSRRFDDHLYCRSCCVRPARKVIMLLLHVHAHHTGCALHWVLCSEIWTFACGIVDIFLL